MRKKPTGEGLTRVEVARRLKVARVTIERLVREGRLQPSGTRGKAQTFDPAAVQALGRTLRAEARSAGGADRSAYLSARTAFQLARTRAVEQATRVREGQLVEAADVEARLVTTFTEVRTKLLAVPSKLRQRRPALTKEDILEVRALIYEALEALADEKVGAAERGQ